MNIAICDNEAACRAQVQSVVERYAAAHSATDITLTIFECGEDLLESTRKLGGYDIYILDILMPGMNGINLGKQLRNGNFDGKILYLTSSEEYAISAFSVKAYNYILKPIEEATFSAALHEAVSSVAAQSRRSLLVKTRDAAVRLSMDNILYAELIRRCIVYHMAGGKTVESTTIRGSFSEAVQKLLRDNRFLLCGTRLVVNLHYITMVDTEALVFQDREQLFLSKKICRELRSAWYDFWFDKEEKL